MLSKILCCPVNVESSHLGVQSTAFEHFLYVAFAEILSLENAGGDINSGKRSFCFSITHIPASVAQLIVCWPAELEVRVRSPSEDGHQCW